MSRYPIQPITTNWSHYAFAVVAGCMKEISSVNPGVWSGLVVDPNNNGLGLMLHNPGSDIINYANSNYPTLTYNDGLVQIEYFTNSAPWIYNSSIDVHASFKDFTENCGSMLQYEAGHFLYQIGYSATRADATQTAGDFYNTIYDIYNAYMGKDPLTMRYKKWKYGNRQLSQDEINNNIDILFAYSRGVVYKNPVWMYFKKDWWRGVIQ